MAACPRCGEENPERARFCWACGLALGVTRPETRQGEEVRPVSVLFVDLVSFTRRAEQLDPEDTAALLRPYYLRARAEIERLGGSVEKFIGDAVMGLFGAPVAREDDAERAVRAAFGVRNAVAELNAAQPSLDLRVRAGVNTGEALVALGAQPGSGEPLATGDVVNTASRLQAAAPLDGILVGEQTHRATETAVEYGPAHEILAKGKERPVQAWEALSVRPQHVFDLGRRGFAALVGRRHELDVLREAVSAAQGTGSVRLVAIVGEAGLGKTRLLWELFHALEDSGEPFLWRQGRSLPYGAGVTYWALAEIVKAQAAILENDGSEVAGRKLTRAVAAVLGDEREAQWVERHLRPLVGLGEQELLGADRRAEAFAAWRRFVEALAGVRPLVLAIEDVQWADDGLLDFLDHLVEWVRDVPVTILCTARPELLERRARWAAGAHLHLEPLSDEDTLELLEALLAGTSAPEDVTRALVARVGGNPLYAEEYVWMLADRGFLERDGVDLPLPDTLRSIVAARLDELPSGDRTALQDAAVVGRRFWVGSLAAVSGVPEHELLERLRRLEEKRFLRPQPRSWVEDEAQYAFWHTLVRDVSYGQIPRSRRAEKHRLAAEWIASIAPDRTENMAELLAHHYLCAIEFGRASGQDVRALEERGRLVLRDAGERALRLYAFTAAVRFYAAACELWPPADPGRPLLLLRYGTARFWADGAGEETLEEARNALAAAGETEAAAEAAVLLSRLRLTRGDRERATRLAAEAGALVGEAAPSPAKARVLSNLSGFAMVAGEVRDAIRLGFEAMQIAQELDLPEIEAHALNNVGVARAFSGDLGGIPDLERSISISVRLSSPEAVRGYSNLGSLLANVGELERAFGLYAQGRAAAERFGDARGLRWLAAERLHELYWRGEWDAAVAGAQEGIDAAESGSEHYTELDSRQVRGAIALARGEVDAAAADATRALLLARAAGDPQALFPALSLHVRVLLALQDGRAAAAAADELLALWQARGYDLPSFWVTSLAFSLRELGRGRELAAAAGRAPLRTRWLEAAVEVAAGRFRAAAQAFAAIGSRPDEALARLRAAAAARDAGRSEEEEAELAGARRFYEQVGVTTVGSESVRSS